MKKRKQDEPQTQITNEAKKTNLASNLSHEGKVIVLVKMVTDNTNGATLRELGRTYGFDVVVSTITKLDSPTDMQKLARATLFGYSALEAANKKTLDTRDADTAETIAIALDTYEEESEGDEGEALEANEGDKNEGLQAGVGFLSEDSRYTYDENVGVLGENNENEHS